MTSSTGSDGNSQQQATVTCVECKGSFAPAQTIRYQGDYVCAGCKGAYFERVYAAEPVPVEVRKYASFNARFFAKLIDILILNVVQLPLTLLAMLAAPKNQVASPGHVPVAYFAVIVALYTGSFAMSAAYQIYFLGKHGATPGKMALKIHVGTVDGSKPTYARAAGRYLAELVSGMTCFAGYLLVPFDAEARALHDHIAGTRVYQDK